MNHPIMFLDRENKKKLVPVSFFYELKKKKKKISQKMCHISTITISLLYKETN